MIAEADVLSFESELRQNLMRGYRRVRNAQSQGVRLSPGECILELLGDPHLLLFTDKDSRLRLRIPIVYVADWILKRGEDAVQGVKKAMQNPDDVLTCYKRFRDYGGDHAGIHRVLVRALQEYSQEFPDKKVLLDWLHAVRPEEEDHDEIRSENWFAYHQAQAEPDAIFAHIADDIPSQVRSVDGLVRLTFPISEETEDPARMVTLVLGLDLKKEGGGVITSEHATSRIAKTVRHIAGVLLGEIPQLYRRVNNRRTHSSMTVRAPEWVRRPDRDPLHEAVDDLHRKIIALASRVGLEHWTEQVSGFNFLIAFRELDDRYRATLRYCLSIYNLHALGSGYERVQEWRAAFERNLACNEASLERLFLRSYGLDKGMEQHRVYRRLCEEAIENIFREGREFNEIRRDLAEKIESFPYHMQLTPGYWVMDQCHPEVICHWLSDPRARKFDQYPAVLLVWEATALPDQIYYSPIVDGAVPVGVCGVNEELIDSERCPAYELQELIDESALRFRSILSSRELSDINSELLARRRELGDAIGDGSRLWVPILKRFRRLAYYYLPNVDDYHTKLVRNTELEDLFGDKKWIQNGNRSWWECHGVSSKHLDALQRATHVGANQGRIVDDERDFLGEHIREIIDELTKLPPNLPEASVYRIQLSDAPDVSLVVLIPNPCHHDLAHELVDRFLSTCEAALDSYADKVEKLGKLVSSESDKRESEPYHVFLSYNSQDREFVDTVARGLQSYGINPWYDEWALRPGQSVIAAIEEGIDTIPCAAVFVSTKGEGIWQGTEIPILLERFIREGGTLFVVLIDEVDRQQIRPFLRNTRAIHCSRSDDPIKELAEAIRTALDRPASKRSPRPRGPHWV